LPTDIPAALESLIESTGNNTLASKLSDLLGELQVLNARVTELPRLPSLMGGLQMMIEDYMIQAAEIYANASSLFAFARREVDDVNVGQQLGVRSALNLLEMRDHQFERLHETAARRYGEDYSREHTVEIEDTGSEVAD
jgi:hypothetical protein